jgi:hypothetical protein
MTSRKTINELLALIDGYVASFESVLARGECDPVDGSFTLLESSLGARRRPD